MKIITAKKINDQTTTTTNGIHIEAPNHQINIVFIMLLFVYFNNNGKSKRIKCEPVCDRGRKKEFGKRVKSFVRRTFFCECLCLYVCQSVWVCVCVLRVLLSLALSLLRECHRQAVFTPFLYVLCLEKVLLFEFIPEISPLC